MSDTTPASDAEFARAQRAVARGWVTKEQLEAAVVAHEKDSLKPLLAHLALSPEQIRELDDGAPTTVEGRAKSDRFTLPSEVAEAMKDPARRVGRFVLVSLLGKGGMGMVFRAWQPELRQWVALKFLKQIGDDTARAYFQREAQLAAGLDHPNIARIYEIGEHDGQPFIAMQFVDGAPLSGKDLKLDEKLRIVRSIAEAVKYAHARSIIHRDLKPANVMLDKGGQVYVMDFGLAKETAVDGESIGGSSLVVGTPSYMAPEQALGKADHQSDVYGIGAILYELVTGRPPFTGESPTDVMVQVVKEEPVWPRKLSPATPPDLEAIILHALEKDKGRRYPDAAALLEDLNAFAEKNPLRHARRPTFSYVVGKKIRKQPLLWAFGALAVAAILGGSVFGTLQLVRARREAVRAQREAEERALVEREGRDRAERDAWSARLEAARGFYEQSFALEREGHLLEAAAASLRAVELAPRNLKPEGYPTSWDEPGWAEEAWIRYRFLAPLLPRPLRRLKGHTDRVTGVAMSEDGKIAVTGSLDKTARVWEVSSGRELHRLDHDEAVTLVAVSPDAKSALSVSNSFVRVWDLASGREQRRLEHKDYLPQTVGAATFSADSRRVLTATGWNGLCEWDLETGVRLRQTQRVVYGLTGGSFSSDGRLLLAGTRAGELVLIDLPRDRSSWRKETRLTPSGIDLRPDGNSVALGSREGELWILSTREDGEPRRLMGLGDYACVAFNRGSKHQSALESQMVIAGTHSGAVGIWDAETGALLRQWQETATAISSLALNAEEDLAVVGRADGGVTVWHVPLGRRGRILWGFEGSHLGCTPDRRHIIGWRPEFRDADILDLTTEKTERIGIKPNDLSNLAVSPDGKFAAYGDRESGIAVMGLSSGIVLRSFELESKVGGVAFSPDGRTVASGSFDKTVRLWDLETYKELKRFEGHTDAVIRVAFSPDGRIILSASKDKTLRLWDIETKRELRRLEGHRDFVDACSFSGDGRFILSASWDHSVRLWEADTGRELRRYDGHAGWVVDAGFCPGGRTGYSAGFDGTVRFWDLPTRHELRRVQIQHGFNALVVAGGKKLIIGPVLWDVLEEESTPPAVHRDTRDPYDEFAPIYERVGIAVVREGPSRGQFAGVHADEDKSADRRSSSPLEKPELIDSKRLQADAWQKANQAANIIEDREKKTWEENLALTPEDLKEIRHQRDILTAQTQNIKDLLEWLQRDKAIGFEDFLRSSVQLQKLRFKLRDAEAVVDRRVNPAGQAGILIAMNTNIRKLRAAQDQLKELDRTMNDLQKRNNSEERAEALGRVQRLKKTLQECVSELSLLDDYLKSDEALGDPAEKIRPIPPDELSQIKEQRGLAAQAVTQAEELIRILK